MYNKLLAEDIVLSAENVSTPAWSNNTNTLDKSEMFTESVVSTTAQDFYCNVCQDSGTGSVQFSIAYADKRGYGAKPYNSASNFSPSRTTYGQYRTFALGDEDADFKFDDTTVSQNFWVLSIDRARYKEKLKPGSLQLILSGSVATKTFVDAGILANQKVVTYVDSGRIYNIYDSSSLASNPSSCGYFLPDIGTILLDCEKVRTLCGITPGTGSGAGVDSTANPKILYNGIQSFQLNAEETVSSNYIFVRAKNAEFNYSMNPSFLTSNGEVSHSVMVNAPETYVTTVGLYNDNADLLAVAKLSRPLLKNFTKEALIRIKLDY